MNLDRLLSRNPEDFYHETDSGAYQLVLRLAQPTIITVGALGSHKYPSGIYLYTGRASRGLRRRIERHLKAEKKLRWHIDYLLEHAQIEGVRVYPEKASEECLINNEMALAVGGIFPMNGFGSSDCRCTSHLMLIPEAQFRNLEPMTGTIPPKRKQDV